LNKIKLVNSKLKLSNELNLECFKIKEFKIKIFWS